MRVKTYNFNPIFRRLAPLNMAGGRKGFLNQRCLLYYIYHILNDSLACRIRDRLSQNHCCVAITRPE